MSVNPSKTSRHTPEEKQATTNKVQAAAHVTASVPEEVNVPVVEQCEAPPKHVTVVSIGARYAVPALAAR